MPFAKNSKGILVIEDDPSFSSLLVEILQEDFNYNPVLARNLADYHRIKAENDYSIVMSDNDLPKRSGQDVSHDTGSTIIVPYLIQNEPLVKTALVTGTEPEDNKHIQEAVIMGVYLIPKPFDHNRLEEFLEYNWTGPIKAHPPK